ncbi:MAG: SPOR domain-containing protein [Bacteroidales bacterium]|nr:SPOR domain-containing protein [Bacteroidales bacterium]
MDITKYIYDYLMEYNTSVIVPDLGCFTIVNKPSEIKDGIVIPPVKTVELDSENTRDDNVLTLYIAKKKNISVEQAAKEVRDFYQRFFIHKLLLERKITFDEFGIFLLNEYGIVFIPDANFFKDNYGLGDAYIPGDAAQRPQPDLTAAAPYTPVTPRPTVSEPVQEPDAKFESEGSLFDAVDRTRLRENTERRRPAAEKPVQTARPARTTPPPKKRQEQIKTGHPNLKVLWIMLAAVALGVAGYFAYPIVYPKVTSLFDSNMFASNDTAFNTTTPDNEEKPLYADETEADTLNSEVALTLDDATDKKNALNPAGTAAPSTSPSQSKPATEPSAPKAAESVTFSQSQSSVGSGAYVLIIGSFATYSAAEAYGKELQAAGIDSEIVDAGNQRYRISVASFDNKAEAIRQANQMKSKPYYEKVWVARR